MAKGICERCKVNEAEGKDYDGGGLSFECDDCEKKDRGWLGRQIKSAKAAIKHREKTPLRTYYLHTIEGKPAYFNQSQICFLCQGRSLNKILVSSLRTIRRQQMESIRFRRENGMKHDVGQYGYLRIRL